MSAASRCELPTRTGWVRPVNDVSFALGEGEALGIVGESGSGKTMLGARADGTRCRTARAAGRSVARTRQRGNGDRSSAGNPPVQPRQAPISSRRARTKCARSAAREIAMIFQEPMTALNPVMRVGAQIAEAIRVHDAALGAAEIAPRASSPRSNARPFPNPALRARQYPHQLSGGLRQRVMIAMALAAGPARADRRRAHHGARRHRAEADSRAARTLRRELRPCAALHHARSRRGRASCRPRRGDVRGPHRRGRPGARSAAASAASLHGGLLRASPRLAREKLAPIPGSVPSLDALPPGCAFAPRCPLRIAECRRDAGAARGPASAPMHQRAIQVGLC